MVRQHTTTALGLSYGLTAGAAAGALLLALTGSALWLAFTPGVGLLVGLTAGWMVERRAGGRSG